MGHMWPNVTSGLLTAHIKLILINLGRISSLVKAYEVGQRTYGPSKFWPVNDPLCKWATTSSETFRPANDQWVIWHSQGPISLLAY